jgi:hypothetical protein
MRYGRLMQRLRVLTLTPVLLLVVTVMSERGEGADGSILPPDDQGIQRATIVMDS